MLVVLLASFASSRAPDMVVTDTELSDLDPLNLGPISSLRTRRTVFVAGLRNPSWIDSNDCPFVSGMKRASTKSVNSDKPPNRK